MIDNRDRDQIYRAVRTAIEDCFNTVKDDAHKEIRRPDVSLDRYPDYPSEILKALGCHHLEYLGKIKYLRIPMSLWGCLVAQCFSSKSYRQVTVDLCLDFSSGPPSFVGIPVYPEYSSRNDSIDVVYSPLYSGDEKVVRYHIPYVPPSHSSRGTALREKLRFNRNA